jgi:hypothetical protein
MQEAADAEPPWYESTSTAIRTPELHAKIPHTEITTTKRDSDELLMASSIVLVDR